jgi:ubiquinone/menaquinone biosynthesis C-methylase UbiE/ADP-ribose pyrophosphatase YjhB (NUDIX family)
MPELLSAALFERDGHALAAHRKVSRPPFAGHWVLPLTLVGADETAEDALRRHTREQFGIDAGEEQFVDTVYLEDPADSARYVANIFRAPLDTAPMRFNTEGDYDDARWLVGGELESLLMPPPLRAPILRVLNGEEVAPSIDWSDAGAQALPLGERATPPAAPPPDNVASWDAISKAYQEQRFGELYGDELMWSWLSSERHLQVLGDVSGKRALVVGCGGGQDCVALAKMGSVSVGVDPSGEQIRYARQYAATHGIENAAFAETGAEDLSRFDDQSFDIVVSSHALNYVLELERAVAEVQRVLRGGGMFAFAVSHPLSAVVSAEPPYMAERSYFDDVLDWSWDFAQGNAPRFRQRMPTVSRWYEMLTDAGFAVERIIEPR